MEAKPQKGVFAPSQFYEYLLTVRSGDAKKYAALDKSLRSSVDYYERRKQAHAAEEGKAA